MPIIQLLKGTSNPVNMEVFAPSTGVVVRGASIVVAYGTDGLSSESKPLIEDFCRSLAMAGYTATLPRFLEITRTIPGVNTVSAALTATNLALWTKALAEAVNSCRTNQGNDRIGLIGFSLGGYMSARTALTTPVKCLIDFFGPMTRFGMMAFPTGEEFNATKAKQLPPTQIHHGKNDIIVLPAESANLHSWLKAGAIPSELHDDYDCGHPQQPEGRPWSTVEQTKAMPAVLRFLSTI